MQLDSNQLQIQLGYNFNNIDLLQLALSHRSSGAAHNERLEFLGDSLVNMAVAELLYLRFPDSHEGELSAMRSLLVCKETLASVARDLKIGDHLVLGQGTSKSGGHRLDSILADTYEALLGAVYLDSSWSQIVEIVDRHFSSKAENIGDIDSARDAKSRLQERLQGGGHPLPNYELVEIGGPGHSQRFRINCSVEILPGDHVGEGSSRRKAEQKAAERVLELLGEADD